MLISQSGGWRSIFTRWIPWWFSDRVEDGFAVAYRILWTVVATLDGLQEIALQGIFAAWPGFGTPTALAMIGRSRGMIRGMSESDASYAKRLREWLTRWQTAGSQHNLIAAFHEYVLGNPRGFIVNRAGQRVSIAADGTLTEDVIAWDWDSLSNPERNASPSHATFWSELWIVVYATPWAVSAATWPDLAWGNHETGLGHLVPRADVDAIKGLLEAGPSQHSAHSCVRCVIWSYDDTLFDSSTPATMPDGTWGHWSYAVGNAARHRSGRFRSCRYWEPERDPAANPVELPTAVGSVITLADPI